jgi:hypothetical protein
VACTQPTCKGGGCSFLETRSLLAAGFCTGGGCNIDGFGVAADFHTRLAGGCWLSLRVASPPAPVGLPAWRCQRGDELLLTQTPRPHTPPTIEQPCAE